MRRLRLVALGVALAAPFYLLLIDTASLPELYVIPAVVLLVGLSVFVASGQEITGAIVSPAWLLRGWRALSRVPLDIGLVCVELVAQLRRLEPRRGQLRAVRFRGGEDGHDVGRAALTESLGSFAPNTIVIGVDLERDLLLVHQLRRHGGREELDVLRLG